MILTAVYSVSATMTKTTRAIPLGDSAIAVTLYENPGAAITFFAPHHNEQTGLTLAREYVERRGGRLVEIVSLDDRGKPLRNIRFSSGGKQYSVDPNRIFTENGRNCNIAVEVRANVGVFANEILKLLLAPDGKKLREGERFIVAVHNNTDVSARAPDQQSGDLNAVSFLRTQSTDSLVSGAYEAQSDGVFLSNTEVDEDNFIFVSSPLQMGYFAEKGFNVVVQKPQPKLVSNFCKIDDGSLSVYSGLNSVPYVCLEADANSGAFRQRQMLDAVYGLL